MAVKKKTKITKKSKIIKRNKVICISHQEDLDGISSAALIKEVFGGYTVLVDYPSQMSEISNIAGDKKIKKIIHL